MTVSHDTSDIHLEWPKKDNQHQEGVVTIGCIIEGQEDSSNDSDLNGGTDTGITAPTSDERKKEIGMNDDTLAEGRFATNTGGSGLTIEGDDDDIPESVGDV